MNDFDPTQISPEQVEQNLNAARVRLRDAVVSAELRGYAYKEGPLTPMELSDKEVHSVMRVASKHGWPNSDDSIDIPVQNYSDNSFRDNLLRHKSDEWPDALNNFHCFILAKPIEEFNHDTQKLSEIYGMDPIVHRANALEPEFFSDLRSVFESFGDNAEYVRQQLADEKNAAVLEGLNLGYRIMGRLISRHDIDTEVINAHQMLTA